MKKRFNLGGTAVLVASLVLSSKAVAVQANTTAVYHQSPFLDNMKNLPPIKDRLPQDPKVVNEEPPEYLTYQVGKYGGTLRTVTTIAGWDADVFVMDNEPLLNTPGIQGKEITGNVLKGYSVSSDYKTYTFYMRQGLKWSDGYPVTTQDVKFAFDDVLSNKQLNPTFPQYLLAGGDPNGDPPKLQVVNDYEFKLVFDKPYGDLPVVLAIQGWRGYTDLIKPFHYLKQYHEKYITAAQLKAAEKAANVSDWVKLFTAKDITNWNLTKPTAIGFPVLYPWRIVKATATTEYFERNPYYFKVDAAGNQLPYIDKIKSNLVQNMDIVVLKTISGQVDFSRESAVLPNMPLYRKYAQKANITALLSKFHCPASIVLNFNYKDPEWQKVTQDLRFRQALNLAINRTDLANEVYYGYASPGQIGAASYDVAKANKLLDQMGMKKGPNGYRTTPDGKPFVIPFEVYQLDPQIVPFTQLIVADWKQLGLNVSMKVISQSLWNQLQAANQIQASITWVHTPLYYMQDWAQTWWAPLWWQYHTSNGKKGVKPPAAVEQFYHMVDEVDTLPPSQVQADYQQIVASLRNNLWFNQPLETVGQPLVVNSDIANISDKGYAIGVNFGGEAMFFKHPSEHNGN